MHLQQVCLCSLMFYDLILDVPKPVQEAVPPVQEAPLRLPYYPLPPVPQPPLNLFNPPLLLEPVASSPQELGQVVHPGEQRELVTDYRVPHDEPNRQRHCDKF